MPDGCYISLSDRGVITVKGADALVFLQGLVSADVEGSAEGLGQWSAMLTPQGKYLFDFFITKVGDEIWLECESDRIMDFGRLLHKYKLRADVELGIGEGFCVYALLGDTSFDIPVGSASFIDPRLAVMGRRIILKSNNIDLFKDANLPEGEIELYHQLRIENGLPDSTKDMIPEKALLLENGFDELAGIDWDKGCYVGQELTARTKYRGLVKKRLLPVTFAGNPPSNGCDITLDGKNAGEMKSSSGRVGLALIRLERLELAREKDISFLAGDTKLSVKIPVWIKGIND